MLGAHHFTDSEQPPQEWARAIRANCGKILDDVEPDDWALVDEGKVCPNCIAKSHKFVNGLGYVTFWRKFKKRFDPES